jgi:hypothetical protein
MKGINTTGNTTPRVMGKPPEVDILEATFETGFCLKNGFLGAELQIRTMEMSF